MATPLNTFKSPEAIPTSIREQLDVIVILGGGVPDTPDSPPSYTKARCKYAKEVYEASKFPPNGPPKILAISAGTAHLPQLLSADGLPVWESTASASYLIKELNIPGEDVYCETTSYDTISNAFFTRTNFCDIAGWNKILIITNEFHMLRTRYIFDWIMNVPDLRSTVPPNYELYYLSVPDEGFTKEALAVRATKEQESGNNVKHILSKKYTNLEGVFEFITQNHSFYTAEKLVER
ncbi:unnamed protein product, partial [Heterosigma akashiwo]